MKAQKFFGFRLIAHNSWFLTNGVISIITALLLNILWITTSFAEVPTSEEVIDEIQQNGTVRIIVSLDVAWKPEGKAKNSAAKKFIKKQRDAIKLAQDNLEQRLKQSQFTSDGRLIRKKDSQFPKLKKFDTIPYIAMEEVDSTLLFSLQKMPGIKQIDLDIPDEIFLSDSVPLIGADVVEQSGYNGDGQTVVILDTGVDKTHPQLAGKVIKELCFSQSCPNGSSQQEGDGAALPCGFSAHCDHGTHVAGIVTGVATGAKVIATQVFSNYYSMPASYVSDQIAALEWVYLNYNSVNPPIVAINMSLGGGQYTAPCDSDSRAAIMMNLKAAGVATLIASGNSGYIDSMSAPACISSAISVGATDKYNNSVAYFSNSTSFLDLLAPGVDILSTIPRGQMDYKSGTSMATPHVAGAWAILKSMYPTASIDSLLTDLKNNGISILDGRNNITKSRIDLGNFLSSQEYPLSINSTSNGVVSSLDGKIACGNNCVANYSSGQDVTLQAVANTDFAFKNWDGDCSGTTNPMTLTMDRAKTCTPVFQETSSDTTASLQISKSGDGVGYFKVYLDGQLDFACKKNCLNYINDYPVGTEIKLIAYKVGTESTWGGWSGDCSTNSGVVLVTLDTNTDCTVHFNLVTQ